MKPLFDQLVARGISFRQLAHLSKRLADEHQEQNLAFNHRAVSYWFNGRRNPNAAHRRAIGSLLQLPLVLINEAFDSVAPPLYGTQARSSAPQPAIVHVIRRGRPFDYTSRITADFDLSVPAIYEGAQWEKMFSVYPSNLKRHLDASGQRLCGWVPDETFKPLIPYPLCLVLLKKPNRIPTLDDPEGFDKRVWFLGLPSGKTDVRFMYRDGTQLVTSKPNQGEERFLKGAVDPLGYVTSTLLFRLELTDQVEALQ